MSESEMRLLDRMSTDIRRFGVAAVLQAVAEATNEETERARTEHNSRRAGFYHRAALQVTALAMTLSADEENLP